MNQKLSIETERIDDIPLLQHYLDRLGVSSTLDKHIPVHGNWQGVSLGLVVQVWLSYILSQADHRLCHVESWIEKRLHCFSELVGLELNPLDWADDHLTVVLRLFANDDLWYPFEQAHARYLFRVYDLSKLPIRLDSTALSGYWPVTEDGLFQLGHSKDHRPDLAQLKIMMATVDPMGCPLVTQVVDGSRADDPLYIPAVDQVRESLQKEGLLYVGDSKMSSRATRAHIAYGQDHYLCPLPSQQLSQEELLEYLELLEQGHYELQEFSRETADGYQEVFAQGFELEQKMEVEIDGEKFCWTERHLVIRSVQKAEGMQEDLEERIEKAIEAILELNVRKQGRKRAETLEDLEPRVLQVLRKYRVEEYIDLLYEEMETEKHIRAWGKRKARVEVEKEALVQATRSDTLVEEFGQVAGWRVYATNAPVETLGLEEAILMYRENYRIDRNFHRLKGRPIGLKPMYLQRDDHAKGLVRLLSLALKVLTLAEHEVREKLASREEELMGLYVGNPTRATDKPTTERLLGAFKEVTWTKVNGPGFEYSEVTPLSIVQTTILELLGFSETIYTELRPVGSHPP